MAPISKNYTKLRNFAPYVLANDTGSARSCPRKNVCALDVLKSAVDIGLFSANA
jgi:hypothetical protein